MRRWVCRAALALLGLAALRATAHAQEGLVLDDARHRSAKAIVQNVEAWKDDYKAAVEVLRKLIDTYEAQGGPQSPAVGVLLLDIGEAAVKRSEYTTQGKTEALRRGVRALEAGDRIVQGVRQQYEGAPIALSRGLFYRGTALKQLGDAKGAEAALRQGLAIHWQQFNDHPAQLKFFEPLYEVTPPGPTKIKTAELWLKLSKQFGKPTETAAAMLEAARDLDPAVIAAAETARATAERRAQAGDADGAYAALAKAFRGATPSARRVLTARLKPSIFFIYDDPLAGRTIGWSHEAKPLSSYDKVAVRYFVEARLQPFIAEGRNALMDLILKLETTHGLGDRISARRLCRLIPGSYNGYDGQSLPTSCSNAVVWANWFLRMGDVSRARDLIRIGIDLLADDTAPGAAAALNQARAELANAEARYASPDAFLTSLDAIEREDPTAVPSATRFYAGILRDDPAEIDAALRQAGGSFEALSESLTGDGAKRRTRERGEDLQARLGVTGQKVAVRLCLGGVRDLPAVVRRVQCLRAGAEGRAALSKEPPLSAEAADGSGVMIGAAPELVQVLTGPAADKLAATMARGPGALENDEPLSSEADHIIAWKLKVSEAKLEHSWESGAVALALLKKGELERAREWAAEAYTHDQIMNGGATIYSLWLLEGFREKRFRDGWIYLAAGLPLFAEAAFADFTTDRPTFRNPADPPPADEVSAEFDWTRTIGALHGRMLARIALQDRSAALKDARELVDYSGRALARQSFSRFETRDLVARVAAPALAAAARVLIGKPGRLERGTNPADFDKAFLALQLMKPSTTATTVTRLAARLSTGSPELAARARQREELRAEWDAVRLAAITGQPDRLAEARTLGDALSALDARINQDFPAYVELAGTSAITVERTQGALGGERSLLLVSVFGEDVYVVGLSSKAGRALWIEGGLPLLAANADSLRRSMEPRGGRFPRFRAEEGRAIHRQILAPLWDVVATEQHKTIIEVTEGPLDRIPLAILPTEQAGRFVVDHISDARLPSVSSLVLLESIASDRTHGKPFLGVGDPLLEGEPAQRRGVEQGDVFAHRGSVDLRRLRSLPRLPETAEELFKLSALLGAGSDVALGAEATETKFRQRTLRDYRILAFATHGLVAGEFSGLAEPGLVMSPPDEITPDEDGYLTASEISQLDLSAEMVLLSACNTAASSGRQGAEGLSGLSKAFFFAGARSLLVSHWSVQSEAAVVLTTEMINARQAGRKGGYATALREAMLKLRAGKDGTTEVNPGYWGSFQVVGY